MEPDDRRSNQGVEEAEPPANVVRFPRDWFGPTEDLVPFGPRADELAARAQASGCSSSQRSEDLTPPRADDFWGEGSAAIQHAVLAPQDVRQVSRHPASKPRRRLRLDARFPRPLLRIPRISRPAIRPAGLAAGVAL